MFQILTTLSMFTLLVSVAGQTASTLGDDPAKFDQLVDAASVRNDAAFVAAVLDDDVLFTHGTGKVWKKQDWVNATRTGNNSVSRTVDSLQVERHGDIVETLGHVAVRTTDPAHPERHIFFVRLYVRRAAGWKLLSNRTVREVDGPLPTR
jgi:ketosteroid isomerase-like protein